MKVQITSFKEMEGQYKVYKNTNTGDIALLTPDLCITINGEQLCYKGYEDADRDLNKMGYICVSNNDED